MKAYIGRSIIGSLAFDENGKILDYELFEKNPEKIAEKLGSREIPEEKKLAERLKGFELVFNDETAKKHLKNFRKFALDLRWASSEAELNEILTRVNILLTKTKLREQGRDRILMRVIGIIDELDKDMNIFSERLKEWYGLYFPELPKAVKTNEKFAELVAKYGKKEDIPEFRLQAGESSGMDFSNEDLKSVITFSQSVFDLFKVRNVLEKYLEEEAKKTIPNLSAIAGPLLASRLLSLAGGLEKIAKLPSSAVQLLGSEKALFRHLRDKTRSPKYGVLFAHPYIQKAPNEKKGKIARLIAAKLSLAARIDFFSKEDKSEGLKKDLERQINGVLGGI